MNVRKLTSAQIAWRAAQDIGDGAYVNLGIGRVYTSLAVVDVVDGRFVLREKLPEISLEELQSLTGAELATPVRVADLVAPDLS